MRVEALPNGWTDTTLGAVSRSFAGGTPSRSNPAYYGPGIPWLKSGEVRAGRIFTVEEQITAKGLQESSARVAKSGSPVIAMYGATAGVAGILEIDAALNQAVLAIEPAEMKLDSEFCFHLLSAEGPRLLSMTQGSGQPNLSKGLIDGLTVSLPPLGEQRRIAEVLRSVDEAIAAIQNSMQAAATVRQVTLDAMIRRVLDDPETKVRPLSDVAEVRTGLAKNKNRAGPKVLLPYMRVANVQDGWFDFTEMQEIEVDPAQVGRYLLQAGDVLLTEGGDYDKLGRGGVWKGEVEPCLHQNHVFCVRPSFGVLVPEYFALASQSSWGRAYFLSCAKRTTNLASINSTQLKAFPVPAVPVSVQADLIEEIDGIDTMIGLEERQFETLSRLRSEVASDLLSGRVRVPA